MSIMSIVAKKEFRDGVRDKRALLSAFFFPLSAPLFIYFLLNAVIEMSQVDETVSVPSMALTQHLGLLLTSPKQVSTLTTATLKHSTTLNPKSLTRR